MSATEPPFNSEMVRRLLEERWEAMEYAYDHEDPYGSLPEWIRREVMAKRDL